MKRVIRRPAKRSGKHALLIFLFSLLCAALPLLSGCGGRTVMPDGAQTSETNVSIPADSTVRYDPGETNVSIPVDSTAGYGPGEGEMTPNNGETEEISENAPPIDGGAEEKPATADERSGEERDEPVRTPRVSLGWSGILAFVISFLNFALLLLILLSSSTNEERKKSEMNGKAQREGDAIKNHLAALDDLDERFDEIISSLSSLNDRIQALPRDSASESPEKTSALDDRIQDPPRDSASESLKKTEPETPPPKPQVQYFTVVNSDAADGQPIYLRKKSIRSYLRGTLADNDQSAYFVSPAMSDERNDGKRGKLDPRALYTGDIKVCFDMPNERLTGWNLSVTVEKPAVIRRTGTNQYELEERGKLSVSGGA